jgi:Ca-activated chloride channel family protein
MSKEEKLKAQELKRLLKKMGQKKTPTMIYQMGSPNKGPRRDDVNPW